MLQEIVFDKIFKTPVREGKKTQTIRFGRREYKLGPCKILFTDEETHTINIDDVSYKNFQQITEDESIKDGFLNKVGLKEALLRYYPNMGEDSILTVIKFSS